MVRVHATAIIDAGAQLDGDVSVGPYCIIGKNIRIAKGTCLISHVVLDGHTEIGENNVIHPFAVLGGPPQHLLYANEPTRLVIGKGNLIREHVTIHKGTITGRGVTQVGNGGNYMAGSHIAHDCVVGDHVILANSVLIAGNVVLGDHVLIGGASGVTQNRWVGAHAFVGGGVKVMADIIPYGLVAGNRGVLAGLNLIGLKRRKFSRAKIARLRKAYRLLFAQEGTMAERIEDALREYADDSSIMSIIDFIRASSNLCMPEARTPSPE